MFPLILIFTKIVYIVKEVIFLMNAKQMSSKLKQMREILRQEYTLKLGFKSIMGEI